MADSFTQIARGIVTQVTPTVEVRLMGDSVDVPVSRGNELVTALATNDTVVVVRMSRSGGWSIAYVEVAI